MGSQKWKARGCKGLNSEADRISGVDDGRGRKELMMMLSFGPWGDCVEKDQRGLCVHVGT